MWRRLNTSSDPGSSSDEGKLLNVYVVKKFDIVFTLFTCCMPLANA